VFDTLKIGLTISCDNQLTRLWPFWALSRRVAGGVDKGGKNGGWHIGHIRCMNGGWRSRLAIGSEVAAHGVPGALTRREGGAMERVGQ
jgi:hypothetical protein